MISLRINVGPAEQTEQKEGSGSGQYSNQVQKQQQSNIIRLPAKIKIMPWKEIKTEIKPKQGQNQIKFSKADAITERTVQQLAISHKKHQNNVEVASNNICTAIRPQRKKMTLGEIDNQLDQFHHTNFELTEDYLRTWYEKLAFENIFSKYLQQKSVIRPQTSESLLNNRAVNH